MTKEKIGIPGAILVVIAIGIWAAQNPNQAVDTGENLVNAGEIFVNEVCPIPDKILSAIDESFIQTLPDGEAKQLAEKIRNNEASDCDKWQFFQLLNENQRKKMNWFEFACNVKDCIKK